MSLVKFGFTFCVTHRFEDALKVGVNLNRTLDSPFIVFEFQNVFTRIGKNGVNAVVLRARQFVLVQGVLGYVVDAVITNPDFSVVDSTLTRRQPRHALDDAVVSVLTVFTFLEKQPNNLFVFRFRNVEGKNFVFFVSENVDRNVVVFLENFKLFFGARRRELDSVPVEFIGLLFQFLRDSLSVYINRIQRPRYCPLEAHVVFVFHVDQCFPILNFFRKRNVRRSAIRVLLTFGDDEFHDSFQPPSTSIFQKFGKQLDDLGHHSIVYLVHVSRFINNFLFCRQKSFFFLDNVSGSVYFDENQIQGKLKFVSRVSSEKVGDKGSRGG